MRKKSFLTVLAGLAIMAWLSNLPMAAANQISHYLRYDGTPVIGTDTLGGVTYSTFSYGDLFNSGDPGKPSLPVDYIRFSVPYNATNFSATVTWRMNVTYNLDHLLFPCQAPRWMNDTTPATITLPDTAAYYSGESYPSQRAWVVDEGFLEGENHIVTVAVMPFSYSHSESSDLVSLRKTGTLRLSYELSDSLAIYPIVREDSALREEGYRLAQSMVVNPNQVKSFTVSYNPIGTGVGPIGPINPNGVLPGDGVNGGSLPFFPSDSLTQDSDYVDPNPGIAYDAYAKAPYLIVTTDELYHTMRRLAALKKQKGYDVKIVTLDEIYSSPFSGDGDDVNGNLTYTDEPGKIRQYLRNNYQHCNTRFVLLAGNIPYRSVENKIINGRALTGHGDLYYSDINGNWYDSLAVIDRYPELFVGRLLGDDIDQFDAFTDKLFRYELNPGGGDYSYLNTGIFTEAYEFYSDIVLHGLSGIKGFMSPILSNQISLIESPQNHFPTGCDVLDSIRTHHPAFIFSFNHGAPTHIKTYGADSTGTRYFVLANDLNPVLPSHYTNTEIENGLNRMGNKNYPMIYYSLSCETMLFHKVNGLDMNYGESFTTGRNYGGPVYMGNTKNVLSGVVEQLCRCFAKRIIGGDTMLGKADALSKTDYFNRDFSTEISIVHNYLGDPSLELWTDIPTKYNGITVSRTDSTVSVSGINEANTLVSLYRNDGSVLRRTADSSSVVFNRVSPNSVITVFAHNKIPYIAPLMLQNVQLRKSQYIIASDVLAGRNIDSGRTTGDVKILPGADYEIESSGTVVLNEGFIVEQGASFAVYPSCF